MSLAPQDFLPHLAGWVANLDDVFPGKQLKPYFGQVEVTHILSLVVLGGASILLNLRLIGAGLTDEPVAEVHDNLKGWTWAGVIGVILSGLAIGSANAERLYTSEAFTAKMIGLVAGLILTFGVSLPVARADGVMSRGARAASGAGLAVFALALWVFLSAKLANPGLWHVIFAAGLAALYVTRGRLRWIYLGVTTALVVAQQILTHVTYKPDDFAHLDPVNKTFAWVLAAWIFAAFALHVMGSARREGRSAFVGFMALASILVWVMTAAAGRWLAFA